MKKKSVTLVMFLLVARTGFGQSPAIGVAPYHHEEAPRYRASFGVGANLGHLDDAPLSYVASGSLQTNSGMISVSLITSNNNSSQPPRNSIVEIDALYGLVLDEDLARYQASPQSLHIALSSGIGLTTYQQRWQLFGRRGQKNNGVVVFGTLPNTFEFSPSFPIQVQAFYEPINYGGIGVTVFMSLSKFTPSYGASLSLQARY